MGGGRGRLQEGGFSKWGWRGGGERRVGLIDYYLEIWLALEL